MSGEFARGSNPGDDDARLDALEDQAIEDLWARYNRRRDDMAGTPPGRRRCEDHLAELRSRIAQLNPGGETTTSSEDGW